MEKETNFKSLDSLESLKRVIDEASVDRMTRIELSRQVPCLMS